MREKSFDEEILEEERKNQQLVGKIDDGTGGWEKSRKSSKTNVRERKPVEEHMGENEKMSYGKKERNVRKDIIKNVAIVFLVIMLLLTLFSNTIMNYSLVEVSTQALYGDSITSKVRGSGVVEAGENYMVVMSETRRIDSVKVRTGATVEAGDLLVTLAESESEELKAKRQELEEAEESYETAVLTSGISVAKRNEIESGKTASLAQNHAALDAAQAKVDAAQAKVDAAVSAASNASVDVSKEEADLIRAQQEKVAADEAVNQAQQAMERTKSAYELLLEENPAGEETQNAKTAYEESVQAYVRAQQNVIPFEQAVTKAQNALAAKLEGGNGEQLAQAQKELENAQKDRDALSAELLAQISLKGQYEALAKLRQEIAKMEENAVEGEITSKIAGTVTEIFYTAGQTVPQGETVMMIQPENKAFVVKFMVTADQAKRIKKGDEAKILNNWYGDDIHAVVSSIRKSMEDKNQYEVICELSGDVSVGANYTLSIGEKSASYDFVVPTSCIREDSNGKFILVIESKSTPLGNRYYARHVQVEVITSDDTYSAISGPLSMGDYVITTTSKPVEDNQQVRLAD